MSQLPWETQTKNCGRKASYITEDSFFSLFLLGKTHKTKENNFLSVVSKNQMHTHDPANPFTQLMLLLPTLIIKPAKALKKERGKQGKKRGNLASVTNSKQFTGSS